MEYYQIFGRECPGEVFETLFINKENEDPKEEQHYDPYTLNVNGGEPNLKDYIGMPATGFIYTILK